eukprot:TRINITY_DN14392_c0_g2_i2.p1 TRINITY_DN14392_c0_g2~~TRINITY_DN14392_c0_g2_i2.p1  ORF type:complete len:1993 (-),score=357.53 TRINITY_DN14392_c0_g2_i2:188-6166(-)
MGDGQTPLLESRGSNRLVPEGTELNLDLVRACRQRMRSLQPSECPFLPYQLMAYAQNEQNNTIVEKAVVLQEELVNFCNDVLPLSCKKDASEIRFERLEGKTCSWYGVFGQNSAIARFLVSHRVVAPDFPFGELGTGIYAFCCLNPEQAGPVCDAILSFLVIWAKDDIAFQIEAENPATILLRYLTQLCTHVIVCLDEKCAKDFPSQRGSVEVARRMIFNVERTSIQDEMFVLHPNGSQLELGPQAKPLSSGFSSGSSLTYADVKLSTDPSSSQLWEFTHTKQDIMPKKLKQLLADFDINVDPHMPLKEQFLLLKLYAEARKLENSDGSLELEDKLMEDLLASNGGGNRADTNDVQADYAALLLHEVRKRVGLVSTTLAQALGDDAEDMAAAMNSVTVNLAGHSPVKALKEYDIEGAIHILTAIHVADKGFDMFKNNEMVNHIHLLFKTREPISNLLDTLKFHPISISNPVESLLGMKKPSARKEAESVVEEIKQKRVTFDTFFSEKLGDREQFVKGRIIKAITLLTMKIADTNRSDHSHKVDTQKTYLHKIWSNLPKPKDPECGPRITLKSCKNDQNHKGEHFISLKGELFEVPVSSFKYHLKQVLLSESYEQNLQRDGTASFLAYPTPRGFLLVRRNEEVVGAHLMKVNNDWKLLAAVNINEQNEEQCKLILIDLNRGTTTCFKTWPRHATLIALEERAKQLCVYFWESEGARHEDGDEGGDERRPHRHDIVMLQFGNSFQSIESNKKTTPWWPAAEFQLSRYGVNDKVAQLCFLQGGKMLALRDECGHMYIANKGKCQDGLQPLSPSSCWESMLSIDNGQCLVAITTPRNDQVQVHAFMGQQLKKIIVSIPAPPPGGHWVSFSLGKDRPQPFLGYLEKNGKVTMYSAEVAYRESGERLLQESGDGASVEASRNLTPLEYVFYVYKKFPVQGELQDSIGVDCPLKLFILFDCHEELLKKLAGSVKSYLKSIQSLLEKGKKPLSSLHLVRNHTVGTISNFAGDDPAQRIKFMQAAMSNAPGMVSLSQWLKQIICLVPIQIARAEENAFKLLSNRLPIHVTNTAQAKSVLHFGIYEALLNWWKGDIVVVSSMGRQSTGKSYMLNHLFGTSFEVSGGRCTDGCWMAVRVYENRLYVVLDFEGVGSVERTDQEDMLLSLFNASLSGCTLFRTENRVDRTMEEMFSRFQAGVGRMNWKEERLFKGSLLIIIKDVVTEWKDVFREFESKLNNILFPNGLQAEEDQGFNFISKMYGKRLEIVASPSLGDEEYYEILASIGETLQNKQPLFQNGQEFLELMKLIMARLHLTDCNTSLQGWELKMRLEYLNSHLAAAIYTGRLQSDDEEDDFNDGSLLCLESGEEIPYQDIISLLPEHHCLKSSSANLHLTDAEFTLSATNRDEKEVVAKLKKFLEDDAGYMRTGDNHEAWFSQLQSLLDWAAAGRSLRVEKWAKSNLTRFGKDGNEDDLPDGAKGVLSEVAARGRDLQQISSLCGQECSKCFLQCLLFRGHPDHEHDCFGKGDHVCDCACQWCKEDGKDSPCKEKMGHSGNHDCRVEVHTCTETCDLSKFRNCQGRCQKRAGHEGEDHQCNARHLCGENCLAHGCQGKCSIPSDQVHSVHSCQRGSCTQTCAVAGCGRLCSALDHFHNSQYSLTYMNENMIEVAAGVDMFQGIHYCGATHKCPEKCQVSGICSVERRFVMKEDEEYHGARSTFKYKAVLEDNGKREDCAIEIPKYRLKHDGDHVHSTGGNVVHTCMDKCPTCNYYCDLPMNHDGEHSTAHGNMRKSILISEDENIDIEARHGEVPELGNEGAAASDITMSTRKYKAGESGKAEMCDLFCKAMGRGHVHVIDCEESRAGRVCTHSGEDGRRHEKYHWKGKDDKLVDEVTHEAYWKYMGWKDPCHANDRQIFQKCPAECGMHEKNMAEGMARPACTLPIWHQPIIHGSPEAQALAASGYISIDGHHFDCSHLIVKNKVHSVLVLDESYSMEMVWGQLEVL